MAIKTYRPTTQTLRYRTTLVNDDLTTSKPHKPLLEPKTRTGGRRNSGNITSRFRGGGNKRKLRLIDFKRDKQGIPATVASIEYDPNRSARIALLSYADGEKRYILQPDGLKVGQKVVSGPEADILVGNALPLRMFLPAPWSTTSSFVLARARKWFAPPAALLSWWRKKATTRS